MGKPLHILHVEDSERDHELVLSELRRSGVAVTTERVDTPEAMAAALGQAEPWDVILCDYAMPHFGAPSALALTRATGLDLPFIIISGTIGEETAVAAMQAGADDFFVKHRLGPRLMAAIEREMGEAASRRKQREATRALEESQEKLDVVLSNSHVVLYCCDALGPFRVSYISPNTEKILGYSAEDFARSGFWQSCVHPEDLPAILEGRTSALESGGATREYRFRHRDGSWRWMLDVLKLQHGAQGEPVSYLGTWTDVTEVRRTREQLMIADRMVSMGTLAAGVAHEVNNPLSAVIANLELATGDLAVRAAEIGLGSELAEVREMLQDASEGAHRIREIVRDLKMFSRSSEENVTPVDLRRVLESTLRMAWNEVRHRARLVKSFGETPLCQASESRLGQVFLNLVLNAAQACPEGGADRHEIRVSTRTDGAGRAVVEITDTGSGMPPEVLSRLFTPFFTTKPIGMGTGLGLSICRRIVTEHGGEIEVWSEVGKGTTFRVLLPPGRVPVGRPSVPAPSASAPPSARRGRILVVDDDASAAKATERTLSAAHQVVAVTRAREALERILAGERFDVLLVDLMMPDMTGMDLYAALLGAAPEQAARMLVLTGGAFTPRARAFLDETRLPVIEKPFEPKRLRDAINQRLQG